MRNTKKYAAIGYVVSKVVLPLARQQGKKAAKRKARGAVTGAAQAARNNPAKLSILVGATVGAIGWLVTRRGHDDDG